MTQRISGGVFKQMIVFGAACITQQKQAINDLNVFPVPDGDTGTNMSLTIQTAVTELSRTQPESIAEASKTTASALLRGAARQLRRHPEPAVPRRLQVLQGGCAMRTACARRRAAEGVTTAYGRRS